LDLPCQKDAGGNTVKALSESGAHFIKTTIMKTPIFLGVAGSTLLIAASNAGAQSDKWYLDADAGAAIQQDVNIKNGGGRVDFDTGFRSGLVLGYNFFDSLAAEFETGVIGNSINGINGNLTPGASAQIYEIPMLANVIYKIPTGSGWTPYFGVGIGGAATMLQSSNVPLGFPKSDTDFTLACQGTAGLKYALGKNMELGLAYKFIGTTDHSWSQGGVTFKTDGTMTHSIMASFTWKF
jgi:OOP family OmpA-OmpF porin